MKLPQSSFFVLGLLLLAPAPAQTNLDEHLQFRQMNELQENSTAKKKPALDPKRIINESSGFLKEREPEMNAEEYAIYERVVTMLSTKPEFALKLLEAMVNEKEPPSPAFQFILGNAYYATGDLPKSEAAYLDAIKRYPTFLRAWNNLGVLYYSDQRYADAVRCFSKCATLGDRDPLTYGLLGYSLEQERKIVPAEMAYMQALSGDPNNTDWLEGLLRIYIQGKQYARAEWLARDLIRQRPADARFWVTFADILLAQNRRLEAIALLEVCMGTGIAGTTEQDVLAGLYAEQHLVPEAIDAYRRVMRALPDLGERKMLTFARVLTSDGRFADAERVFTALNGHVSPAALTDYRLARSELLMAQQKWPQAGTELEEVVRAEPLNGRALLGLGRAYAAQGNLPRAQLTFEAAVRVPDTTYRASLELATLELRNRHYDKTVLYLEQALGIEKSAPVQDLLARVRPLADKVR